MRFLFLRAGGSLCFCTLSLLFCGCDSVSRATSAPQIAVVVTVPTSETPQPETPKEPASVTIIDVAPALPVTNLLYPPTDVDVPFNQDEPTLRPCEPKNSGRGHGIGAPGNGKGRGDHCDE